MDSTKILNFISNNYGTLTAIGVSIWGLVKTNIFPLIKEFVASKNSLIKDETTRTLVESAEQKVKDLLETTMSAIETTTKEELISKIASGELTNDALSTLPSIVINKVKNQLSDKYKDALKSEYSDVEDYLATKAQYLYDKYKNDNTSVIGTVKVSDVINTTTEIAGVTDVSAKTTELLDKLKDVAEQKVDENAVLSTDNVNTAIDSVSSTVCSSISITSTVASSINSNVDVMSAMENKLPTNIPV